MWIVKVKGSPAATMQDGRWSSTDKVFERHLNRIFTPARILESQTTADPEGEAVQAMVRSFGDQVDWTSQTGTMATR
jgi:hypothetical protein